MQPRIVILGAGESGIGTAVLAKKLGADVFVSDSGTVKPAVAAELNALGVAWEQGAHTEALILNADEVVKSPGIPDNAPLILRLRFNGIPVINEIEYAARHTKAKLIGITGTNGKTTTTLLTYHIFKNAGYKVGLGGNIGKSFARQVAEQDFDYYILEISSFQLDGMFNTRLDVGVLTNITPDHLDRYDYQLENYVASKLRIAQNMGPEQVLLYCADDPITTQALEGASIKARKIAFSLNQKLEEGAWKEDKNMIISINQDTMTVPFDELSLKGRHNAYNAMAASVPAKLYDIRKEAIRDSLSSFEQVEHRLEAVATIKGVEYINDSKATNVNSTWYALESFNSPIVWIAGGVDKGNDYEALKELVKERVKAIVCLGTDNRRIHEEFGALVPVIVNTTSMEECVKMSHHLAVKGDIVLLSPACASFDLFDNYEDRGRQFKKHVKAL
ncbi:MAG: UDP-N-acetylmuramoyl-L-alanine--D-glutamate ligase [Sphingobacteriaceae bacterium]|nr:UDP-N-acetylmuramoyl-L-alanine--D-glutamate ligase [Sphingobacteriaceae bacterium]